jgi:sRNA-binding protein
VIPAIPSWTRKSRTWDAVEPALDVAGAAAGEIRERQREQAPHEVIERAGVDADRREREQVTLGRERGDDEDDREAHREDEEVEQ